jgi:hypothetical protein
VWQITKKAIPFEGIGMTKKRIISSRQPKTTHRQRPKKPVRRVPINPRPSEPTNENAVYNYLYEDLYRDNEEGDEQ